VAQAVQTTRAGEEDAFVTKLNATGSALVYSTHLGGSNVTQSPLEGGDVGMRIAVDADGMNVYVTGLTRSLNFPITAAAHQRVFGGGTCGYLDYLCADAFVAKIGCEGPLCKPSGGGGGGGSEPLQVLLDGDGAGSVASDPGGIACPGDCEESYREGTQVALTAVPSSGSRFDRWTGCDEVADTVCAVTLTGNQMVTARFVAVSVPPAPPTPAPPAPPAPGPPAPAPPAPPAPAPLATILNQAAFAPGQTLVLTAALTPAVATSVDAYIVIDVPGVGPLSLQLGPQVVAGTVPIGRGFVPFAYTGPVLQYMFTGSEPAGAYQVRAYLTHAGTANVIGSVHVSSLIVTR
jgi:hypothetical protein